MANLTQIKDFVVKTNVDGLSERDAYKLVFKEKATPATLRNLRESEDYAFVANAVRNVHRKETLDEIDKLKLKKAKSYSSLLDAGNELLNLASSTKDVETIAKAQENQRRNLAVSVIEDADNWGFDTSSADYDVLEGVIVQ